MHTHSDTQTPLPQLDAVCKVALCAVCLYDSEELLEKESVSDADVGWMLGTISPPLL